jgi:glycosyltransferase involved in cell wall biosynthesis
MQIAYWVKHFKADIINVHDISTSGSWTYYYSKLLNKVPVIGTPHGSDIQTLSEYQHGERLDPNVDKKVKRNLNSFTRITAISRLLLEEIIEITKDDARVQHIPNGVWISNGIIKRSKTHIRKKYRIPQDRVILISIGNNRPVKGFELGVKALAELINRGLKVTYIIVGRNMDSLTRMAARKGVSKYLLNLGEKEPEEIADLLRASDIYVNTSYMESFGLTTLEAMCAGLPAIVSNISANRELISSENGLFFDPGNIKQIISGVEYMLHHPLEMKKWGKKSQDRAKSYDWSQIASQYLRIYNEAMMEFKLLKPNIH